jgi:hypothetical protein
MRSKVSSRAGNERNSYFFSVPRSIAAVVTEE